MLSLMYFTIQLLSWLETWNHWYHQFIKVSVDGTDDAAGLFQSLLMTWSCDRSACHYCQCWMSAVLIIGVFEHYGWRYKSSRCILSSVTFHFWHFSYGMWPVSSAYDRPGLAASRDFLSYCGMERKQMSDVRWCNKNILGDFPLKSMILYLYL